MIQQRILGLSEVELHRGGTDRPLHRKLSLNGGRRTQRCLEGRHLCPQLREHQKLSASKLRALSQFAGRPPDAPRVPASPGFESPSDAERMRSRPTVPSP